MDVVKAKADDEKQQERKPQRQSRLSRMDRSPPPFTPSGQLDASGISFNASSEVKKADKEAATGDGRGGGGGCEGREDVG